MVVFGVLWQLKVRGFLGCCCCPCSSSSSSSEDANARQAVTALNQSCRLIQVFVVPAASGQFPAINSSIKFLGGLFGGNNTDNDESSSRTIHDPPPAVAPPGTKDSFLARLVVRDSPTDGQPELLIVPLGNSEYNDNNIKNDTDASNNDDNFGLENFNGTEWQDGNKNTKTTRRSSSSRPCNKTVKLRRIDKVLLEGDQVVLRSSKALSTSGTPTAAAGAHPRFGAKELIRFTILQDQQQQSVASQYSDDTNTSAAAAAAPDMLPVPVDSRNLLVHHFMVLTEWERQRRAALVKSNPEAFETDDDDNDDTTNNGRRTNFLTAQAQKMAHFAQREIELQRTKKDRDKRKAQLLQQAGGLKYTALAMAAASQKQQKSSSDA